MKGYFLRKSRLRIFLEKGGILVLTSMNLEKNGLIFMLIYHKKGGSFWTEKSVFYREKCLFWAEKSVFCHKKGGNFQTGEQWWVPLFPVSERAGQLTVFLLPSFDVILRILSRIVIMFFSSSNSRISFVLWNLQFVGLSGYNASIL